MMSDNSRVKILEYIRTSCMEMVDAIDDEIAEIMIAADGYVVPPRSSNEDAGHDQ